MPGKPLASIILPAGIVLASGALGIFLQKVVFGRLRRTAERSSAAWDDILTRLSVGCVALDLSLIKHEFVKELPERFAREGIEIPFPVRTVQIQRSEC